MLSIKDEENMLLPAALRNFNLASLRVMWLKFNNNLTMPKSANGKGGSCCTDSFLRTCARIVKRYRSDIVETIIHRSRSCTVFKVECGRHQGRYRRDYTLSYSEKANCKPNPRDTSRRNMSQAKPKKISTVNQCHVWLTAALFRFDPANYLPFFLFSFLFFRD